MKYSALKQTLCRSKSLPGIIAVMVLLSACQSMPATKLSKKDSADELLSMLDESIKSQASEKDALAERADKDIPADVADALVPPVSIDLGSDSKLNMEQRFDLDVEKTPLQVFYMSLVKGTPYNMIVHPGLEGEISLSLKNVSVHEAMEAVRRVYGFEYRRTSIGYEVMPNEMQTRIFKINYLNVSRNGTSQIRVTSGQITESSEGGASTDAEAGGGKSVSSSGSLIDTKTEADFWKELKESIKAFVPDEDDRRVIVSPQSGVVVVRAMPNELSEIDKFLDETQLIVKRQVILEAKILEVELSEGFQSGINWAALADGQGDTALFGQTGGGTVFNGNGVSDIAGATGVLDPNAFSAIQNTATSAFGGVFSAALSIGDFTAFIEALETQGDVHVLSSPRVSTVNNQKAVIKVGEDEFFVTGISTETLESTGGGAQQSVDVELTPFFSGAALDVTPQIDENNEVTLHVHPSVSDIREKVKQIDISVTDSLSVPLASSTIRESDSIVSAKSGQVIVIGGLMQNVSNDETAGVPWLGRLPLVGGLFRHEKRSFKKSELVILLKPVVVDNNEVWKNQIEQSRDMFKGLTSMDEPEQEQGAADGLSLNQSE